MTGAGHWLVIYGEWVGDVAQEEKEEVASRPAAAAEKEVVRGLLSRAFHQPPRSVSLHNLLDLQPDPGVSHVVLPCHVLLYACMCLLARQAL